MAKVGIIGAGLAGLTLASRLAGTADVTLFEKARGVSGRMATRRAEPFSFDHGAQYFTARSEPFQDFIAPYVERGLLADWEPHFLMMEAGKAPLTADKHGPHYVGVPHMNAFLKAVAEPFSILLECQIARIEPGEDGVVLLDRDGEQHGPFDWVISTAPAAQSHQLKPHAFSGHDALDTARVMGCFTLMLGYHRTLSPEFDGLFVEGSPVGWIANNASKPGREGPASIVVQSTN
ncbi:MAG: NAD(P)-binding protein, partial [Pseudomonadota bacterium]